MSLATPLLKGVGKPEREIGEASDPIDGEIPPPHDTGWAFQRRPLLFLVVSDRSFLPRGISEAIESARHPVGIVRGRSAF